MRHASIVVFLAAGGMWWGQASLPAAPLPLPQASSNVSTAGADRDTTQKIRRALMDDKTLSTDAHNVKIMVKEGKVTLRGAVRSDAEKQAVAQKASGVAGADNITNELTILTAR